jgi:hypothetical protein
MCSENFKETKMRFAWIITFVGAATIISAQQSPPKQFQSSADVAAMIAKAKNERKPEQANFIQPLLQAAPYTANLEYRVKGVDTNPNVHEREAELFYVIEGGGTLTTGGKLREASKPGEFDRHRD